MNRRPDKNEQDELGRGERRGGMEFGRRSPRFIRGYFNFVFVAPTKSATLPAARPPRPRLPPLRQSSSHGQTRSEGA